MQSVRVTFKNGVTSAATSFWRLFVVCTGRCANQSASTDFDAKCGCRRSMWDEASAHAGRRLRKTRCSQASIEGGNESSSRSLVRRRCHMVQKPYPAEKARGGEIILNTPARRAIFVAGLIGAVVLALILVFVR